MKTLSQLKRDLSLGAFVILTDSPTMPNHKYLNTPRYIIKIQSNGVILSPDAKGTKGSFMVFPKASLMEYENDTLKIFNPGLRDLTVEEKQIMDNCPRDKEQEDIDIKTDTSVMYHRIVAYFDGLNAGYLRGRCSERGMRYDHDTGKVWDETIEGTLDRVYKINFIL